MCKQSAWVIMSTSLAQAGAGGEGLPAVYELAAQAIVCVHLLPHQSFE